jgi:hypothetical protein
MDEKMEGKTYDKWMKKGKEEVGYLLLMDGNMDEELVPSG